MNKIKLSINKQTNTYIINKYIFNVRFFSFKTLLLTHLIEVLSKLFIRDKENATIVI